MIRTRHHQPSLWTAVLAEEAEELWEPWMRAADRLLDDERLVERVFEAQAKRFLKSRTRGRKQTPAEVVLRLLILKHVRDWSYEVLEREVRANLVYRTFTRIGAEKVPDAKTLGRLGQVVGPEVIVDLHRRVVEIAVENRLVRGRRMRVDTTVIETNIHYPTDSSLLGDGTRVLTRVMKRVEQAAGDLVSKVRNRMRTVRKKVVAIALAARQKGAAGEEKRRGLYKGLLSVTRKIVNQAKRVMAEVDEMSRRKKKRLSGLRSQLATMVERVQQVIKQTKARVFRGDTKFEQKLASVFESQTEIIRKGKASKPTEFGKLLKIQEAENQIVTHFEVYEERPTDSSLLVKAVETHEERTGSAPQIVAADAGFYSQANEKRLEEMGVTNISIPNRHTRSPQRRSHEKRRSFRAGQRWRTGCEGRISVLKRRHGLSRSLYRGLDGMRRWVGMGVIADNLINMGRLLAG
jgi:transposase, IS5 family